jgi:hypothetical protein
MWNAYDQQHNWTSLRFHTTFLWHFRDNSAVQTTKPPLPLLTGFPLLVASAISLTFMYWCTHKECSERVGHVPFHARVG